MGLVLDGKLMNKTDLVKEGRRTSLYWKLRNRGMPRLLATLVARLWPMLGERRRSSGRNHS